MREAVIVDVVRTPLGRGKANGKLHHWHPADLAAQPIKALLSRTGIDPALVEDVILGCVSQVGEQAMNIARTAALTADLPYSAVGTTIDRQCGSSQQCLHFAAQGVMAGAYDVVIAAGVESMGRVPMGSNMKGFGSPLSPALIEKYKKLNLYDRGGFVNQGIAAETIAQRWKISRRELDEFSVESHRRAAAATQKGHFKNEIVSLEVTLEDGSREIMETDEGIRANSSLEKLAALEPAFDPKGVITAANSSQITDGASAALVMSKEKAKQLGLRPRARFHAFALAGVDPIIMLTAPIPATQKILEKTSLTLKDIDAVEINEAFAPVVLAWQRETKADMNRVNPNGGAIAIGHPLGATGVRLTATLLNELERSGGRYGLQTLCEGGGMANALILERLD